MWAKVSRAVTNGLLGEEAKVSTARPNSNASDPNKHVICVYTYDVEDKADVMRIRRQLRDLGVTWKIPYKTDRATYQGRYQVRGDRRISTYYE